MSDPTVTCTKCGARRNCMLHTRADHPPTAARAWLKRTCKRGGKPCEFGYRAGFEVVGRAGAMSKPDGK
jgi:hypothetical protein